MNVWLIYTCFHFVYVYVVHCEWITVENGECRPNCGGGEIERYYIITQEPAHGGQNCPPTVRDNRTEIEQCCSKYLSSGLIISDNILLLVHKSILQIM